MDVKLIPAEEMIWSKGLIMERERFDGADVAHVIKAVGPDTRLAAPHRSLRASLARALRAHHPLRLHLSVASLECAGVGHEGARRARRATRREQPDAKEKICYGTIISRQQYLKDINDWGYQDARLQPLGNMTAKEIAHWTAGIAEDGAK